jgi:hypothetical protein
MHRCERGLISSWRSVASSGYVGNAFNWPIGCWPIAAMKLASEHPQSGLWHPNRVRQTNVLREAAAPVQQPGS